MNLPSCYRLSLTTISLIVCPLLMSVMTFPEVVFGTEVQELRSGLSAQGEITRKAEADRLKEQGNQQYGITQFEAALQSYQQALIIYREIKDRLGEGAVLGNLGNTYFSLDEYDKAIKYHQQSLKIAQEIKNRVAEGNSLSYLGSSYMNRGKYDKAIEYHQQSLKIAREIKNRVAEGASLENLGIAYNAIGKYEEEIKYHLQSIDIYREIKDRANEGFSIRNLGNAYYSLGKYDKAIEYQLQSLAIAREVKNRRDEGLSLGSLGKTYLHLGKYDKAIEYQLQRVEIAREIKSRLDELNGLGNLGFSYLAIGKYNKAIDYLQEVLVISREIKNRRGEGISMGVLGDAYYALGKYDKAIEYNLQWLAIAREIKDRSGEMSAIYGLGTAYKSLDRHQEVIVYYQQALTIAREIGSRSTEGSILGEVGEVLAKVKQPELAILFYKQSVNVREAIRKDIRKLDKDIQKSYLATVEDTYRNLADLLLKQDRILEAQQVLDLLKVQELSDYLKTVRGNSQTAKGVDIQRPEQNIIALGNELAELQKLDRLTPTQEQRLAYLTNQESDRNQQFNAFLQSPEVQKQIKQLSLEKAKNVDLEEYNRLRESLSQVKNAALFYPLILDDRLELILITATTPPIRKTVNLKREELNKSISDFITSLRDPSSSDVKDDGQKFYNYLIKPFEKELQEAKIQTIIYAPDGQLRYIPLAALYDGKQWLVERYRINNITASSLTNLRPRTYKQPRVLAAAATNSQNVNSIAFGALPATKTEVEAIASLIPRTTILLDSQFNKIDTVPKMQSNTIVHLATHGYFAVGQPEESFIVFGDSSFASIADIKKWTLTNVELVVLSACETAIGGKVGNGIEILGLGYQIQSAGAGASIASLWKVSDEGTQALMQKLYESLKQKDMSSSEALRQAQIAMIHSDRQGMGSDRASIRVVGTLQNATSGQFSHPFYWSAFILIGNGL